jgi:hypothetical protein
LYAISWHIELIAAAEKEKERKQEQRHFMGNTKRLEAKGIKL